MSASSQLQQSVLLAATSDYAACMEAQHWLADNFHGHALFGGVKSWSRTSLAHPKRESLNIVIVIKAIHLGSDTRRSLDPKQCQEFV